MIGCLSSSERSTTFLPSKLTKTDFQTKKWTKKGGYTRRGTADFKSTAKDPLKGCRLNTKETRSIKLLTTRTGKLDLYVAPAGFTTFTVRPWRWLSYARSGDIEWALQSSASCIRPPYSRLKVSTTGFDPGNEIGRVNACCGHELPNS
jgi:hypothetical protein